MLKEDILFGFFFNSKFVVRCIKCSIWESHQQMPRLKKQMLLISRDTSIGGILNVCGNTKCIGALGCWGKILSWIYRFWENLESGLVFNKLRKKPFPNKKY